MVVREPRPAAASFAGHRVAFHDNGRRIGAPLLIVQWRNGVPVSVFPEATAMASVNWPRY
jgi:branched-chain amino acid transport system substrate-binding protein